MYYFDPRTSGFYLQTFEGAVALTDESYWVLINGQSEGGVITVDSDGKPRLDVQQKTQEELLAQAAAKADVLLAVATTKIAPLQDAEDLDEALPAEIEQLRKWKKYRVDISRVSAQVGYPMEIEWPAPPA
ncbi:tail fiber assembly protein [Pseudomonas sp. B6002]|uniref:tail fiber assembly protein n=1 Tax=Pseudomonas sp. B6002 TaxID=2726978 RepID=UPI0015A02874|nr:tail fiber assembly protein [Pseudomonas sp. B6002]NVZ49450.1 tail fiber assembly protein [Pseudomonas sp. B6002]